MLWGFFFYRHSFCFCGLGLLQPSLLFLFPFQKIFGNVLFASLCLETMWFEFRPSTKSHIPTCLCLLVLLSDRHASSETWRVYWRAGGWWGGGWHLSDGRFLQPVCVCKNMCTSGVFWGFLFFFLLRKPKAQEFGPGSHLTSGAAGTQQWSAMGCRADQCHM